MSSEPSPKPAELYDAVNAALIGALTTGPKEELAEVQRLVQVAVAALDFPVMRDVHADVATAVRAAEVALQKSERFAARRALVSARGRLAPPGARYTEP